VSGPFLQFTVDPQRCIGCKACEAACAECDTHHGTPMIHIDFVEPGVSPQTTPTVCMHCENPTCASVCPADAIKVDENGIVHSSLKPRCIACNNCELACPFGVPKISIGLAHMQKCDMCFDRTSVGKRPMCATVCPTGALFYGTAEQLHARRPQGEAINLWRFGLQEIRTRVRVMVPAGVEILEIDVADILPVDEPAAEPVALSAQAREFL
jgi:Fe-S-cluster-containing dehydrogenase component